MTAPQDIQDTVSDAAPDTALDATLPRKPRDPVVRRAALLCFGGLGGFLLWAGLAPLEEGIAASGTIVVENDRQVVQHFEGGIVEAVTVREGDWVEAGQIVATLRETASLSSRDQLRTQIAALIAREARLEAMLTDLPEADFSGLDALNLSETRREALAAQERNLLRAERQADAAQAALLRDRAEAARRTADLGDTQIESTRAAARLVRDELDRNRELLAQQLIRRDVLTRLERDLSGLDVDIARMISERDQAAASAADAEQQLAESHAQRRKDASVELRDARAERLAALESLNAAQDVLDRAVLVAPVSGKVFDLAFTTPGSVVPSGETLMEIVPEDASLVASVRIRPTDRAAVHSGQTVRTQVSAYRSWESPRIRGEVVDISGDLKTDPANGASFYEARVRLSAEDLQRHTRIQPIPGMPVDAFIYAGNSRTTLDYIFAPLVESAFKGLRAG